VFVKQRGRIKLISLLVLLIITGALMVSGNRLVCEQLDRRLPGFLTEQLGIAVSLQPTRARLLKLEVSTSRLVMGDPDAPAIDAREVLLRLDKTALLSAELRFEHVQAEDLTVSISRWPKSGSPWPGNYHFLDQWLPRTLQLTQGRYLPAAGAPWSIGKASVRREADGNARLQWTETRPKGKLEFALTVHSLYELLDMSRWQLDLALSGPAVPGSKADFKLDIRPDQGQGYEMDAEVDSPALVGKISTGNPLAWLAPNTSTLDIQSLKTGQITALVQAVMKQGESQDLHEFLATTLPTLNLPTHHSQVKIERVEINDELLLKTRATVMTGANGLDISAVEAEGPAATLSGQAGIAQQESGWAVTLSGNLAAHGKDSTIAPKYLDADWLWRSGHLKLEGSGDTWGGLLNHLEGELEMAGSHRGTSSTPVQLQARLTSRDDILQMENIQANIGESIVSGSLELSGQARKKLVVKLRGDVVNLKFLFSEPGRKPAPGLPIPEYLGLFPELDVSWDVELDALRLPDLALMQLKFNYERSIGLAQLTASARGTKHGAINLDLVSRLQAQGKQSDLTANIKLKDVDLRSLFDERSNLFDTRATGQLALESRGENVVELFRELQGQAELSLVLLPDDPSPEQVSLKSAAQLVVNQDTILGVSLTNLDIDSLQQDVTGSLSMVARRSPWIIAALKADRLNVDQIADWVPRSAADADQADLLRNLRDLGPVQLSLDASSLQWFGAALTDVEARLSSGKDTFSFNKLNFVTGYGKLESNASLTWQADLADFKASAHLQEVPLDHFLGRGQLNDDAGGKMHIAGSLDLSSQGKSLGKLLENLRGHAVLESKTPPGAKAPSAMLELVFKRANDAQGLEIDIKQLRREDSFLTGKVLYNDSAVPEIDITISGGHLALHPWEKLDTTAPETGGKKAGGSIAGVARTSGRVAREVLETPMRLFGGAGETGSKDRYFSDENINLDFLKSFEGSLDAHLDRITSNVGETQGLSIKATLSSGLLQADAKADHVNGGTASISASIDASKPEYPATLQSTFTGVGRHLQETAPRSGVISLNSSGSSQAELAANMDGQVFLQLGRGPLDYSGLAFMTTDLATGAIRSLIPGAEKQTPELQCGVTLAHFQDGMMVTPYGYAAQTRTANLMGRMQVNLKEETMRMQFDSRSRSGVGISVGNVFSNTIAIQGPLTKPTMTPRTTSLLWRGWAAVMTAGVSIIGESVVKRALAAKDPCGDILQEIRKKECKAPSPLLEYPQVCPANPGAS
jgi:hypothetical protein